MKHIFSLVLFIILYSNIQAQTYQGVRTMGDPNHPSYCYDMAIDATGNQFICGQYYYSADFDPGPGTTILNSVSYSAYVAKYNAAGNLVWVKSIGDGNFMAAYKVKLDNANNLVILGSFSGTMDFDPGASVFNMTSVGTSSSSFLLKLDQGGNFMWANKFDASSGYFDATVLQIDTSNSIYTGGDFYGAVDFNPGTANNTITSVNQDIAIVKLDANGNYVWAKSYSTPNAFDYAYLNGMTVSNNAVYLVGTFNGTYDFNPGTSASYLTSPNSFGNYYDAAFIAKLDGSGNYVYAKKIGAVFSTVDANDIQLTNNAELVVAGRYDQTVDFNPGSGVSNMIALGYRDAYVLKLDTNANYIWSKSFGGNSAAFIDNKLAIDPSNQIYMLTSFLGKIDADPSSNVYPIDNPSSGGGNYDPLVIKLDNTGNMIWSGRIEQMYASYETMARTFALDNNLNLFIAGDYDGLVDFDPTANTDLQPFLSSTNIFITKYKPCGQHSYTTIQGCDTVYYQGIPYTYNANFLELYNNVNNCDSNIAVALKINYPTSGSVNVTACNSYTLNGQTYTNSGVYTQMLTNVVSCDSTLTLNLSIGTLATSHTISPIACKWYTSSGQTYTAAGMYTQTLVNASGCDSVLTIFLSINTVDTAVTQSSNVLTASASPAIYQWMDCGNNQPIPGANGQTFIATANGSYALIASQNSCTDTSSCYTVTGVGVLDFENTFGITIHPNPSDGFYTIAFKNEFSNARMEVSDLIGRIISKESFNGKLHSFYINGTKGIYLLKLYAEGKQQTIRLVKE